jgi:hypothetical protein
MLLHNKSVAAAAAAAADNFRDLTADKADASPEV